MQMKDKVLSDVKHYSDYTNATEAFNDVKSMILNYMATGTLSYLQGTKMAGAIVAILTDWKIKTEGENYEARDGMGRKGDA